MVFEHFVINPIVNHITKHSTYADKSTRYKTISCYKIQNVRSTKFLDSKDDGSVFFNSANAGWNQIWQWDGSYLTNVQTGLVLESEYIDVYTKVMNGDDCQKWILTKATVGYKVQNKASSRFIVIDSQSLFTSTFDKLINNVTWNFFKSLFSRSRFLFVNQIINLVFTLYSSCSNLLNKNR